MKMKNADQSTGMKGGFRGRADARDRIIQKRRRIPMDARDILARITSRQDARIKLLKIRERNRGKNVLNCVIRPIGRNILKMTDRNGRISLFTNKSRLSRDLNPPLQNRLGFTSLRRAAIKKMIPRMSSVSAAPRKKTLLPLAPRSHPAYRWDRPSTSSSADDGMQSLMVSDGERTNLTSGGNGKPLGSSPVNGSSGSNIRSRPYLTYPETESLRILATKMRIVVPVGHRIVICNLQNMVTENDIQELFEVFGQVLEARLMTPGTAEVIYKNLEDAKKAVYAYHNRLLDGQPMKCRLDNQRTISKPAASGFNPAAEGFSSTPRTDPSTLSTNKLMPDMSIIHKILFHSD